MTEPRNFDEEYGYGALEQPSFILGGHEFHAKVVAPPSAYLMKEEGVLAAITFLRHILIPDDRDILNKMVDDPDVLISAVQLDAIATWLIGETSGRPTESPASSGPGVGGTASGSTESAPSQVVTTEG